MNPFENENDTSSFKEKYNITLGKYSFSNETINDLLKNNNNIELWVEDRGRKCDTFLVGLNLSNDDLKQHLKTIKKKLGCNGSIKYSDNGKLLHLQGDHKDYLLDYFTKIGIHNIKLKG
jgi:translation initiation factor 1 (eIF-1/SUI1)